MATVEDKQTHYLKDAKGYKKSLKDDREVYFRGERIDDVTTHPATAGGIDNIAELYQLQFDQEAQKLLTYVRDDGARVTASYLVPKTKEDLVFRREGIKRVVHEELAGDVARDRAPHLNIAVAHMLGEPPLSERLGHPLRR